MRDSNKSRGDFSPLATQLQQAWLQSQIPKVQKRRLSTTPAQGGRGSSFYRTDPLQNGSFTADFPGLASHRTDLTQPSASLEGLNHSVFPERPVLPTLSSYSTKTCNFRARRGRDDDPASTSGRNVCPRRSLSTSGVEALPSASEQGAASSNAFFVERGARSSSLQNDHSAAEDSSRETEVPPLTLLHNIPLDEGGSEMKRSTDTSSSYRVKAEEIVDLLRDVSVPETSCSYASNGSPEMCDDDNSWIDEILCVPEQSEAHTEADGWMHENSGGLSHLAADTSKGGSQTVSIKLKENEMGWCSEALNVNQYLDRESRAPARMDCGDYLPPLKQEKIESSVRSWFEASYGADLPPVDLSHLLLRCAKMMEQNDVRKANDLIRELRQHSSAYGNGLQRMAYYFMEALVARLSGTGGQLYAAVCSNGPPPVMLLKAYRLYVDNLPYTKINHLFSNTTILDTFKGASCVHVIDYGIGNGVQWPCLIQDLATRPGGPPHLRITGIDRQQPGSNSSKGVLETGCRLTEFARLWKVPFEYHAFAEKWETITTAQLALRKDEVLAVNCFELHNLLDESVMAESPRKIVLSRIQSLNPKVFIQGVVSGGYNAPFFMTRFQECMRHFSVMFDAVEGSIPPDDPNRVLLEQEWFGREILNIVACEGLERVERAEPYRQWQSRTQRAGFTQRPLNPEILSKMKVMMGSYHKDFGIGEDGGWILTGWKNHIVHGLSTWEPSSVATNP